MTDSSCHEEVCITCSDQLLEVVVTAVSADGSTARATCDGRPCDVSIELLDGVVSGEHLLAHGGVALQRAQVPVSR